MRIAIVGSRDFRSRVPVVELVDTLSWDDVVVSGGARGPDSWAVEAVMARIEAGEMQFEPDVILPPYEIFGAKVRHLAPLVRNAVIAATCDRMVAFWNGESRGTENAIKCAKWLGKPVEIIT